MNATDRDPARVKAYFERGRYTLACLFLGTEEDRKPDYKVRYMPTTYIIGPDGTIWSRAVTGRAPELTAMIEEALKRTQEAK